MSLVHLEKTKVKYRNECEEFVELAFHHSTINVGIVKTKKMLDKDNVTFHLLTKGWYQDYACLKQ